MAGVPVVTRNARGEDADEDMEAIEFAGGLGGGAGPRAAPGRWSRAPETQLFPLAPIQRERVPCPMEDPVYGLYRHQYFTAYFP